MIFTSSHIQLRLEESQNSAAIHLSKNRIILIKELSPVGRHRDTRYATSQITALFDHIHVIGQEANVHLKRMQLKKANYRGTIKRSWNMKTGNLGSERFYDFSLLWKQMPIYGGRAFRQIAYKDLSRAKFLFFSNNSGDYLFPVFI